MLRFIFRKMFNKKWMMLALLIGNVLLISIAACNPLYIDAVTQRILTREFSDSMARENEYPATIEMSISMLVKKDGSVSNYNTYLTNEALMDEIPERYGVPRLLCAKRSSIFGFNACLAEDRSDVGELSFTLASLTDLENNAEVLAGRMFTSEPDENGVYDAMVSMRAFIKFDMMLGDVYEMKGMTGPDREPILIRIVGIFGAREGCENFWVDSPASYTGCVLMHSEAYDRLFFSNDTIAYSASCKWYLLLDYTAFRADDAQKYLDETVRLETENKAEDNFRPLIESFLLEKNQAAATFRILQIPLYALLLAFIFMVSGQILENEQNEIAVLKSRGAGKGQLITIYFIQSVLLAAAAFAIGVPLGDLLCRAIGSSNAFLEFVSRATLVTRFRQEVWFYAVGAAVIGIATMTLPVLKYSSVSIVAFKTNKNAKKKNPLWQKLFLDVLLLGVSLYGLYSFNNQKSELAQRVAQGESLDPILYLCSSLFMIGGALFALRVIPLAVRCVYYPLRNKLGPAMYTSFLTVLRQRRKQHFMMVFIMMTVALGLFNADCASSINQVREKQLRYNLGSDIILTEVWDSTTTGGMMESTQIYYKEPDISVYSQLPETESMARVYTTKVKVSYGGESKLESTLTAINTKEFGETCYMPEGLNGVHINTYLNALASDPYGSIISRNLADAYELREGDTFSFYIDSTDRIQVKVSGIVDYFPGYNPTVIVKNIDGTTHTEENYLVVANLSTVQAKWGMKPYSLWIRSNSDSLQYIYDYAESSGKMYHRLEDSASSLIDMKNNALIQGTNGILTISFIVVLLLCAVGFLIYWILAIRQRSLQFGIYRAMGMTVKDVAVMLINEQVWISGTSVAMGILIGLLTGRLYIPLIQLAYSTADSCLPIEVVISMPDHIKLYVIVGITLILSMSVLVLLVRRLKIAQALKLGED